MASRRRRNVFVDEIKHIDPYNLPLAEIKGPIERMYKYKGNSRQSLNESQKSLTLPPTELGDKNDVEDHYGEIRDVPKQNTWDPNQDLINPMQRRK